MKHTADLTEQQEQELADLMHYIEPIGKDYCNKLDVEYPTTWSNRLTVPILLHVISYFDKKVQNLTNVEKKCETLQQTVNKQRAEIEKLSAVVSELGVDAKMESVGSIKEDAKPQAAGVDVTLNKRKMIIGSIVIGFFLTCGVLVGYIHNETDKLVQNEVKDTVILKPTAKKLSFAEKAELIKRQADSANSVLTNKK